MTRTLCYVHQSSWKSALDHPEEVWRFLDEECKAGFIDKIPSGLPELHPKYSPVAVGKLGLVLAEGRSPRLVVDSTMSGVTNNILIPNRMLLPRITDVLQVAPTNPSAFDMIGFSMDVSKAHRRIKIAPSDGGFL